MSVPRDDLEAVLRKLPYKTREAFKLRHGVGDGYRYTTEEIARVFKTTPVEAAKMLEHGEAAVQKAIPEWEPEDG